MSAIKRIILDVLMNDGTLHEGVVITTADRIKSESVGRRQKWGSIEESQQTYSTFWAYAALARLGLFSGSFEDFVNQNELVTGQDGDDVDPTVTTAGTD